LLLFIISSLVTAKLKGHFSGQTKEEAENKDIENEETVVEQVKEE